MQVAVKDQQDIYRSDFHLKECIGNLTVKADKQVTLLEDKESSIFTNQSKTVESLLPDEDDLFSGVLDELACTATSNVNDEDFDLFNSNGGMELEGNCKEYLHPSNPVTAEHLKTCVHPSRALIVKNVDKRVNESELRFLFEQHGDIQYFYTTCRYQGFVIISYYDIRAATTAFTTLQNKLLEAEKLLIQYLDLKGDTSGQYIDQACLEVVNCDPTVSNDQLYQLFIKFGEIEEIWGSIHHRHIKYYDIRATKAAINGLNNSNMLQEPEPAKSLIHQFTPALVQGQLRSYQNPNGNSLPQVVNSCPKDEFIYGLHSPSAVPINANCCVTNSFPSAVRMPSSYDQFGHSPRFFTNQVKLHNHFPIFQPQSLPISCKGFVDSCIISHDCINLATVGFTTQTDDKQLHIFGPYANNFQFAGSPQVTCSNSFQNHHHHLNPMWSHSSPYDSGVCAHNTNSLPVTNKSHKRDALTASPLSISRSLGRGRRIAHSRREPVYCHADEQKYELDIERVLSGEDSRTTLMIKNIPNKYSSTMLLSVINEHNQGTYDFLYLPLDFKNKCNMGYAFINMTDPLQIVRFHKFINGKKWEKFHSGKVACLAYARIQGKAALIAHFQESSLMNEDTCCHPILFTTDGPNAGNKEPFPLGPNIHSRRNKNRCNMLEVNENRQEISYQIKNCI